MMSIKEIIALTLILVGIWLNLVLQDTLAKDASTGWEAQRQHYPLPRALSTPRSDPASRPGNKGTAAPTGGTETQAAKTEDPMPANPRRPSASESHDESGCE